MADDASKPFMPGPLDELAPGLRKPSERLPALIAHPRVCRAQDSDLRESIVLASFAEAADARKLHEAFKPLVEAVLLHELTGEPAALSKTPLRALELYCFCPISFDPRPALASFGLREAELGTPESRHALSLLRHEATRVENGPSSEPIARFRAPIAPALPLAAQAEDALRSMDDLSAWGSEPGLLARRLSDVLGQLGHGGVEPTRAGLERLEAALVQDTTDVIRWIPPLCFQGLCDLIAVAAHTTYDCEVQWAVCERDPDTGLSPPPLIKVSGRNGDGHVPLGEHVLRWCVMPRRAGEEIPSLGAWAAHEFGP